MLVTSIFFFFNLVFDRLLTFERSSAHCVEHSLRMFSYNLWEIYNTLSPSTYWKQMWTFCTELSCKVNILNTENLNKTLNRVSLFTCNHTEIVHFVQKYRAETSQWWMKIYRNGSTESRCGHWEHYFFWLVGWLDWGFTYTPSGYKMTDLHLPGTSI